MPDKTYRSGSWRVLQRGAQYPNYSDIMNYLKQCWFEVKVTWAIKIEIGIKTVRVRSMLQSNPYTPLVAGCVHPRKYGRRKVLSAWQ
jgi:hypothetical protein